MDGRLPRSRGPRSRVGTAGRPSNHSGGRSSPRATPPRPRRPAASASLSDRRHASGRSVPATHPSAASPSGRQRTGARRRSRARAHRGTATTTAPADRKADAAAHMVAPVVTTSSTTSTRAPGEPGPRSGHRRPARRGARPGATGLEAPGAPERVAPYRPADSPTDGAARAPRPGRSPRSRRRRAVVGAQITTSTSSAPR